jgi:putative hydrolase of HD superfamily
MFMANKAKQILLFLQDAEKLKTEIRHSYTSDSTRTESVAEHSWFMSLLALLVFEHIKGEVDELKVLKMIIIHDLVEVFAGDIPAFEKSDRKNNKTENERVALKMLTENLTTEKQIEFFDLWEEFEERKTPEAKLAQSLDKIEVIIQHTIASIKTWEQGDFDINPYYKSEYFDFDGFMRILKDIVDRETMEKIDAAGKLDKVSKAHLKRYKESKD